MDYLRKPVYFKYLIFSILILAGDTLYSQSSSNPNPSGPDSIKVFSLIEKAKGFTYNNTDSSIYYASEALKLSIEKNIPSGEAWALNTLGSANYVNGNYDLALINYQKAQEIFKKIKNVNRVAWGLNNLGLIYIGQERFSDAISTYLELLNHPEFSQDSTLQATALFNLGLSYDLSGNQEKALPYLSQSLVVSLKIQNFRLRNLILNRTGEVYFHLQKYEKAKYYYNKVLNAADFQNNWELAFSHAGLSQAYLAEGNSAKSIYHGKESLTYARMVNAKWDAARALKIITDAYAFKKDYENAYKNHLLYKSYTDSLYSEAKEREINYAHLKLKESENNELAQVNYAQLQRIKFNKFVNYSIATAAFLLSFLGFVIYRNNKRRSALNHELLKKNADIARQTDQLHRQKIYLETLNNTKDKLFSIISHDLKSPISSIIGTLEIIRIGNIKLDEQQAIFKNLHNKVHLVNQMLHNLLYWANAQQMGIKTKPKCIDLYSLIQKVIPVAMLIAQEKNIIIDHQKNNDRRALGDEDHLMIIFQNIIANAVKFTPEGGVVTISYSEDEEMEIVQIKDTGVGIPDEKMNRLFCDMGSDIAGIGTNSEGGTGIGLMLVQQFAKANNGTVKVISKVDHGTVVTIALPKYSEEKFAGSRMKYTSLKN